MAGLLTWSAVLVLMPAASVAAAAVRTADAVPAAVAADPGPPPTVEGDDTGDAFVGTGGLLLPGDGVPASSRRAVATCPGCSWRLSLYCRRGTDLACGELPQTCPPDHMRLRVWWQRPSDAPSWLLLGTTCVGPAGPTTVAEFGAAVRDGFVDRMPPSRLTAQPPGQTLTALATIFAAGQPAQLPPFTAAVLGFEVTVIARPTWIWDFGDGNGLTTGVPGGVWPDRSVSHVYRVAGTRQVSVRTVWTAEFTVDGLGPLPVTEPVQQTDRLILRVREARAVLVPGRTG